jgi:hypothetical protein
MVLFMYVFYCKTVWLKVKFSRFACETTVVALVKRHMVGSFVLFCSLGWSILARCAFNQVGTSQLGVSLNLLGGVLEDFRQQANP